MLPISSPDGQSSVLPVAMNKLQPTSSQINRFTEIVTHVFHNFPIGNCFISELDHLQPPYSENSITIPRRYQYFHPAFATAASSNAEFVEAGDWAALALWEPPNYNGSTFSDGRANAGPVLVEWRETVKRLKAKYMGTVDGYEGGDDREGNQEKRGSSPSSSSSSSTQPHWHLAFLVRNPDPSVPSVHGAVSAVVRPFLERAIRDGVPVWLEAITPHGVRVYEHYGFRVCEVVTIGAGTHAADGWPKEGGEGMPAWPMVFDAHLR